MMTKLTQHELMEAARANVEANADWTEQATPDEIYDKTFALAYDKLVDLDVPALEASIMATAIAQSYAQP
jgi:hypothetical protein